jgi:ketosteroid isomerase-like protein
MSDENLEIIRRGWTAWLRGDLEALVSDWDPNVIWDTSHFHSWPEGTYVGVEGIQKFLREWLEVWGEYEIEIEDVMPTQDGRVISLIAHHGQGGRSGIPMDLEMAQIATFRDGRIVRFDNYEDRAEALEAAGLSE